MAVAVTYASEIRERRCEWCGEPIWLVGATTGGGRFDPVPSTDDAEQFAYRLREETVQGEVQGTPAIRRATMDLQDQGEARRAKIAGEALYRQHGCDQRRGGEK
jgi:hypothetical protein